MKKCSKSAKIFDRIREHKKTRSEKKLLVCSECGKCFPQSRCTEFAINMKMHNAFINADKLIDRRLKGHEMMVWSNNYSITSIGSYIVVHPNPAISKELFEKVFFF